MTESAFITLHETGVIDFNTRVNINYDVNSLGTTQGLIQGAGTITGVTVTPDSLPESTPGIPTQALGENIEEVLQGITQISFSATLGSNPPIQVTLQVETRTYYPNPGGNEFYYFKVTPFIIPINTIPLENPQINANTQVVFSPFLQDIVFGYSEYNPLVSNAEVARKSKTLLESDRIRGTVLPSNFNAILADTADPANVQDSNYYSTGWTHSRYEGSKSTPSNYGGVIPALSGRGVVGERYDDNVTDLQVCYADNRNLQEFFHTGKSLLPSMSLEILGPGLNGDIQFSTTVFTYSIGTGITLSSPIDVGDLISLDNEIMRVTKHNTGANQLFVERGYFSSATGHSNATPLKKLDKITLFELKDNTSNLEILNDSKVFIKKNLSIVFTDESGNAYSQSQCPIDLLEID